MDLILSFNQRFHLTNFLLLGSIGTFDSLDSFGVNAIVGTLSSVDVNVCTTSLGSSVVVTSSGNTFVTFDTRKQLRRRLLLLRLKLASPHSPQLGLWPGCLCKHLKKFSIHYFLNIIKNK